MPEVHPVPLAFHCRGLLSAQKVISTDFDDDECRRVFIKEASNSRFTRLCCITGDTRIGYLPGGQSSKQGWPILAGRCPGAEGNTVTKG